MSINHRIHRAGRAARFPVVAAVLAVSLLPTLTGPAAPAAPAASAGTAGAAVGTAAVGGSARAQAVAEPLAPGVARPAEAVAPGAAGPVAPLPAAAPATAAPAVAAPRVAAKAAILADESTGQVLFERNPGVPRAMASTTKVMTALLALERLDERRVVVIGVGPTRVGEESLALRRGERLTVRQLLLGLMLKSANDAGVALAEAVDGSEAAFVRRMNARAASLRLGATRYVTPYGLDRPGHRTSARDLARLWEVAMRRADFRALVATRSAQLPGRPLSLRRFVTTNQLLGPYRWTVGGKTGFTNQARRCLVASASRGGRRLVAVALGSPNAFADVRALFEYGFSKFMRARLAGRGQPVAYAPDRPAAVQVAADVDALVRLDQLDQLRFALPSQPAGGSAAPGRGWFLAGQRRLVPVPLAQPPTGGTAGSPGGGGSPPGGAGGRSPGSSAEAGPTGGTAGTAGAALVAGGMVRLGPVPPEAAAPVIDPFLRRGP